MKSSAMLQQKEIAFQHLVHEPTPTSQDSARVRGTQLEEGVKSLILRGKNTKKNYQFNIPSHLKLDMKAASEASGKNANSKILRSSKSASA